MRNPLQVSFERLADLLSKFGLIDHDRGYRTAELAWPKTLTGFARTSQRTIDLMLLGLLFGPTAIAGIGFAQVWVSLGNGFSNGLGGATIAQVSQRFGAGTIKELNLAFKQNLWVSFVVAAAITVTYWLFPDRLIGVFGASAKSHTYGMTYLKFLSLMMIPYYVNTVFTRTLAGADNTWIPMMIRVSAAILNIVLNVVFIIGLGMGVVGAALGTVIAESAVMVTFAAGFLLGGLPVLGTFPVKFDPRPPYFDSGLSYQIFEISAPLVARRLVQKAARFPLLWMLPVFGPVIVAMYEINRRVRNTMSAPGRGFGTAASSLVGQTLGGGEEERATTFAWDILRFSIVVHLGVATLLFVVARPVAQMFVRDPTNIQTAISFVRIAALALVAMGIEKTATGTLKAAGDTTWPLYARLIGLYLFMLPLTYLGTVTQLGIIGLYLGLLSETAVPALVTFYRMVAGKWTVVSRQYRPTTD